MVCIPEKFFLHGNISREEASQILFKSNKPSSYLVRERDASDGYQYALSFYSNGKQKFQHYKIKFYGGHYIIGTNSSLNFSSLSDIITHYSDNDIAPGEYLKYPIQPNEQPRLKKHVRAILQSLKVPGSDELDFQKGDILAVENELPNRSMLWCKSLKTGEIGFVDDCFVSELNINFDPELDKYDFYHGVPESQLQWEMFLEISNRGGYLLKSSEKSSNMCALCVNLGNGTFRKFGLTKESGNQFKMGAKVHNSLSDLIEHYRKTPLVSDPLLLLTEPILKSCQSDSNTNIPAEEIYVRHEIRLGRDTTDLFANSKDISMEGCLYRLTQRTKKWKLLKVTVNKAMRVLSCFENTDKVRRRAKRVVDLQRAIIYPLDASLYGRAYAFQLVILDSPGEPCVHCLAAASVDDQRKWLKEIHPLCGRSAEIDALAIPNMTAGSTTELSSTGPTDGMHDPKVGGAHRSGVQHVRSLHVTVGHARGIQYKAAHATLALNRVKVAKTVSRERESLSSGCSSGASQSLIAWDEEFHFEDLPADITRLTVTIHPKKRLSVLTATCELSSLTSGCTQDESFALTSSSGGLSTVLGGSSSGSSASNLSPGLMLHLRYTHQTILPVNTYVALRDTLLEDGQESLQVTAALAELCSAEQLHLARSLLLLFTYYGHEERLMTALCRHDIEQQEAELSTLFRGSSLAVGVVDAHMEREARGWVNFCLADVVKKASELGRPLELDSNRLVPGESLERNIDRLAELLSEAVNTIFGAVATCPISLRRVFAVLQDCVGKRWPDQPGVRTRVVSSFLFLRQFAPALNFPKRFGLVPETPSDGTSRTLLLMAKALQNLSGLVKFGVKESFMVPLNSFIESNREKMLQFVDELVNVDRKGPTEPTLKYNSSLSLAPTIRPSRELANIHSICSAHLDGLRELAIRHSDTPGLQQLVVATQNLSRHLQAVKDGGGLSTANCCD